MSSELNVCKVDERVLVPKLILNFLARDKVTGSPDEKRQEFEGLRLKMELGPSFTEVAGANVQFERTETDSSVGRWIHRYSRAADLGT